MTHSTVPCLAASTPLAVVESVGLLSWRPFTAQRSSSIRLCRRGVGRAVCDRRGAAFTVCLCDEEWGGGGGG